MKIILLEKIKNLGNFGEITNVKSGYARNYLIPNKKAILATQENIKSFIKKQDILKKKIEEKITLAKTIAEKINSLKTIYIKAKTGVEGKLFGSIKAKDIAKSINSLGIPIRKNEIQLKKSGLRTIGTHKVNFQLHHEVFATLNINITSK